MTKIKRLIDCTIPVFTCNLRCKYCCNTLTKKYDAPIPKFLYSAEYMAKAISPERMGGICWVNLGGYGETLLSKEIIEYAVELLKLGHFVSIVTNGTVSAAFEKFSKIDEGLRKRLFFKFSFHYLEFKRKNLFDTFFSNIEKIKKSGCSFTVELTPSDDEIEHISDIKKMCMEKLGALCHITVGRDYRKKELSLLTDLPRDEYKKIWQSFDSELFNYKWSVFEQKRKEFCYAGDWSVFLNMYTGDLKQCYCGKILANVYEDISAPIEFEAIGNNCKEPHCYNAHAWLVWGSIPELKSPTYAQLRNRVCNDGSEWLSPEIKEFYSSKLYQTNKEYSKRKKILINLKNSFISKKIMRYAYKTAYLFSFGASRKRLKAVYKAIK